MESSSALTWFVVYASMVAEAFGATSDGHPPVGSPVFAVVGPLLIATLAICVIAVVAISIRSLRRHPSKPTDINDNSSTTIDVGLLAAPPSLALDLDDDNVLDFDEDEEEEEDAQEKEEAKVRRIGNLAQVVKNSRYFRSSAMEEFPYSPRHFRRTVATEAR